MSSYVFWLRKGTSIKYVRNWWGIGAIQNAYSRVQGEGVSSLMFTYALALSLFMFLAGLKVSCFICRNLTLTFIQKRCVCCQKRLYFSNKINLCGYEISFLYLKLFLQTKVSQNTFILILIK